MTITRHYIGPPSIQIDTDRQTITLYGVKYGLSFFEQLGFTDVGTTLRITARGEDGTITLERNLTPENCSRAIADIAAERKRQILGEGFVPEHDQRYKADELAIAAACYAMPKEMQAALTRTESDGTTFVIPRQWPWHARWYKPGNPNNADSRRRQLVKAGALIAAEIERLDALEVERNRAGGG